VVDIDGTLVNKDGNISALDRHALAEAAGAGVQISLCTGRVSTACVEILDELSLDGYHIFFDGALVCNRNLDREVYSQPIAAEIVKRASETALADGVPLDLFSSTHYFVIKEDWRSTLRRRFFKIGATAVDFTTVWQKEKIYKGGIVVSTDEDKRKASDYIAKFNDCLNFTWTVTPAFPDFHFINVVNCCVSKGKALEALTFYLGLKMDEVLAIGDGSNDLSLLSTAGLGIAMQNSAAELKSVAKYITAGVDQSGVAQVIRKFIL
jgi:Cof subfamily protein (haloacid dehalogenase superfamily)